MQVSSDDQVGILAIGCLGNIRGDGRQVIDVGRFAGVLAALAGVFDGSEFDSLGNA